MIILDTSRDTFVTMRCGEYRSGGLSLCPNFLFWYAKHQTTGEEKENEFPGNFTANNGRYVQFNLPTTGWTNGMWLFELRQTTGGNALTTTLAWAQPRGETVDNESYNYTGGDTDTYHIYE